jgi:hypothetical protein
LGWQIARWEPIRSPANRQEDEMIGFVALGIVMLLWILTWETWENWDSEDPADVPAPPLAGGERHV